MAGLVTTFGTSFATANTAQQFSVSLTDRAAKLQQLDDQQQKRNELRAELTRRHEALQSQNGNYSKFHQQRTDEQKEQEKRRLDSIKDRSKQIDEEYKKHSAENSKLQKVFTAEIQDYRATLNQAIGEYSRNSSTGKRIEEEQQNRGSPSNRFSVQDALTPSPDQLRSRFSAKA